MANHVPNKNSVMFIWLKFVVFVEKILFILNVTIYILERNHLLLFINNFIVSVQSNKLGCPDYYYRKRIFKIRTRG